MKSSFNPKTPKKQKHGEAVGLTGWAECCGSVEAGLPAAKDGRSDRCRLGFRG